MFPFGREKPSLVIEDPAFGRMDFDRPIWCHVPAGERGFMVTVDAPERGPSDVQRDLYRRVCQNLVEFKTRAIAFMAKEVGFAANAPPLSVYSVEIDCDRDSIQGKFTLELSDAQADIIHRVSFEDGEPTSYTFDD